MTRTRLLLPLGAAVAIVLLGLVVARVLAQEHPAPADYSPVTVPASGSSPGPSTQTTPASDLDDDEDGYQRLPTTPRSIDGDDDPDDDDDDPDDDDDDDPDDDDD